MPEPLLRFHGAVRCGCAAGPLGLTLSGVAAGTPAERTVLAFSAAAPAEFPQELADAEVERLGLHHYRIAAGTREWVMEAAAVHVHREVAASFYAAIRPRPVPLGRKLLWRAALALAASRPGLAVLRALRR